MVSALLSAVIQFITDGRTYYMERAGALELGWDQIQKLCVPIQKVEGAYLFVTYDWRDVRLGLSTGWDILTKIKYLPPVYIASEGTLS